MTYGDIRDFKDLRKAGLSAIPYAQQVWKYQKPRLRREDEALPTLGLWFGVDLSVASGSGVQVRGLKPRPRALGPLGPRHAKPVESSTLTLRSTLCRTL